MFFGGSWVPGGSLRMPLDPKTLKITGFFHVFNGRCLIFLKLKMALLGSSWFILYI